MAKKKINKDINKDERLKNIIIGVLIAVIFVMGLGYAAFTQQLTINGTAEVTTNWDVHIKSIVPDSVASSVNEGDSVRYTTAGSIYARVVDPNTAEFSSSLISPGDRVIYNVTIENSGDLDAKIADGGVIFSDLTSNSNDAIIYSYSGINPGTVISKNGGTNQFTVSVTYNSNYSGQPSSEQLTKKLMMILNYVQA